MGPPPGPGATVTTAAWGGASRAGPGMVTGMEATTMGTVAVEAEATLTGELAVEAEVEVGVEVEASSTGAVAVEERIRRRERAAAAEARRERRDREAAAMVAWWSGRCVGRASRRSSSLSQTSAPGLGFVCKRAFAIVPEKKGRSSVSLKTKKIYK